MTITWVLVAIVVVGAAAAAAWLIARRHSESQGHRRADQLTAVVADALSAEWAGRIGADSQVVRGAVLHGEPADVQVQLAALVADVRASFEFNGSGPGPCPGPLRIHRRDVGDHGDAGTPVGACPPGGAGPVSEDR